MDSTALLNDVCMNDGLQLLIRHLEPSHTNQCAVLTTYTMAYIKLDTDDNTIWHSVRHTAYWKKPVWIIPIHLAHPYQHWTLSVADASTSILHIFDSIANESLWMDDVKVSSRNMLVNCQLTLGVFEELVNTYLPHAIPGSRA